MIRIHSNKLFVRLALISMWFSVLALFSFAKVINVPTDYATIQAAIHAASNGDEIIVSPNTYHENINFGGKNITLRSTNPTSLTIVAATTIIIDGSSSGSVVTFAGTESTYCTLAGFAIGHGDKGINGNGTLATIQYNNITTNPIGVYDCDGTIQQNNICANSHGLCACDGTIQQNNISGNRASEELSHGGGLLDCGGTIRDNTISGNWAWFGAGLSGCGGKIEDNIISENCTRVSVGGLLDCDGTIQGNIISDNIGNRAVGGLSGCDGTIQDNIISGNIGGDYGCGGLSGCSGTIQNNIISGNSSQGSGGGLSGCGTVQQNVISENIGEVNGGGLEGCGIIRQNIISGNSTWTDGVGGGLYQCNDIIENNVIYSNQAKNGGGLYDCDGAIQNNTILENSADQQGGGLAYCDGIIRNCIIWQNTAASGPQIDIDNCTTPSYSCIQDWTAGGTGNISSDPQLVDPDNGDFHLLLTSPCIDAGGTVTLAQDFDGDPRPVDGIPEPRGDGYDFDIGADEFTTRTTLTVFSPYDSPVPPVGENLLTSGSLVTAYMTSPIVPTVSGTRQVCTGWLGEGSVPASGTISTTTFVLDQPSTITWLWKTQYYLNASANPTYAGSVKFSDGVTPATGWYDSGANVNILAVANPNYEFDYWSGDLSGTNNPESILMDSPKNVTANFSLIPTPTPSDSSRWLIY